MRRFGFLLAVIPLLALLQSCSSLSTMVSGVGTQTVLNPDGSATVRIAVEMEGYSSSVASYVSNAMTEQGFTIIDSDNDNILLSEKTLSPGDRLFRKDEIPFIERTNLFFYENIRINYLLDLERLAGRDISTYFKIKGYCKIVPPEGFFITGLNGEKVKDTEEGKKGNDRTICAWDFNLTNDYAQPIQVTFQYVNKWAISIVFLLGAFWFFRSRNQTRRTGMPNPSYPAQQPVYSQSMPPGQSTYAGPTPPPINQAWQPQPPYMAPSPTYTDETQVRPVHRDQSEDTLVGPTESETTQLFPPALPTKPQFPHQDDEPTLVGPK